MCHIPLCLHAILLLYYYYVLYYGSDLYCMFPRTTTSSSIRTSGRFRSYWKYIPSARSRIRRNPYLQTPRDASIAPTSYLVRVLYDLVKDIRSRAFAIDSCLLGLLEFPPTPPSPPLGRLILVLQYEVYTDDVVLFLFCFVLFAAVVGLVIGNNGPPHSRQLDGILPDIRGHSFL